MYYIHVKMADVLQSFLQGINLYSDMWVLLSHEQLLAILQTLDFTCLQSEKASNKILPC